MNATNSLELMKHGGFDRRSRISDSVPSSAGTFVSKASSLTDDLLTSLSDEQLAGFAPPDTQVRLALARSAHEILHGPLPQDPLALSLKLQHNYMMRLKHSTEALATAARKQRLLDLLSQQLQSASLLPLMTPSLNTRGASSSISNSPLFSATPGQQQHHGATGRLCMPTQPQDHPFRPTSKILPSIHDLIIRSSQQNLDELRGAVSHFPSIEDIRRKHNMSISSSSLHQESLVGKPSLTAGSTTIQQVLSSQQAQVGNEILTEGGSTNGDLDRRPPSSSLPIEARENEDILESENQSESKPRKLPVLPVPLAIDEDANWLSEFHCFIRSELVEVFQASEDDVNARRKTKAVSLGQVGIRCKFCAKCGTNVKRAGRCATFASSLRQIYQSMTMMIREHFKECSAIPDELKAKFYDLQAHGSAGAQESKSYWVYSSQRLGMRDSTSPSSTTGIVMMTEEDAANNLVFNQKKFSCFEGYCNETRNSKNDSKKVRRGGLTKDAVLVVDDENLLVERDDRPYTSEFIFTIMSQFVMCGKTRPPTTTTTTTKGKKRAADGISYMDDNRLNGGGDPTKVACRHCVKKGGGYGTAQMYVRRKCYLPEKLNRMSDHLKRCAACPPVVKNALKDLDEASAPSLEYSESKVFYDRVWNRLKPSSRRKKRKNKK